MKRGPRICDAKPVSAEEVAGWFGTTRCRKPSTEICVEIAHRLDGPPSDQWLRFSDILVKESEGENDDFGFWDIAKVTLALRSLVDALPVIRGHWDNVVDCDDALTARSALRELDTILSKSRRFIEYPVGEYRKRYPKKEPKSWHLPSLLILRVFRETMGNVKSRPFVYSRNSSAVKITHLALVRLGYGIIEHAAIAAYVTRWHAKWDNPMTTNHVSADLLPITGPAD